MRNADRNKSRIDTAFLPSKLASLASSLTKLAIPCICSSAESSTVIKRSVSGMKHDSAFKKVVFPLPVPPLINMLYPAITRLFRNSAASRVIEPISINVWIVIG